MNNTFKRSLVTLAVTASLSLAANSVIAADSSTSGFIIGKAQSAQGNTIAGATITIKNKATGLTRTITTSESGSYKFPLIPAGQYDITAEKNGFIISNQEDVRVSIGSKTNINMILATNQSEVESIEVRGAQLARLDTTSSESLMIVDQELLSRIPVARDVTSVALLAPGTNKGDSDFGNLTSFGGSSVGENTFYVNGMNVTNFRNGLGGTDVPFEMYDSFEVKTGGYSAEFGRSTGGVVNATTKRGTNEFKWGASVYLEPSSLRASQPDTLRTNADAITEAGTAYYVVNNQDDIGENNYNLWASGALIEDKLFFFGLVNQQTRVSDYATSSNAYERDANDTFLGLKLDYYINENNILEFTAFDSSSDLDSSKYNYNPEKNERTSYRGDFTLARGGETYSLKYTSIITDDFTVSAMAGVNKNNSSNLNAGANPLGDTPRIYERRTGIDLGEWALATPSVQEDERKAYRIDFDWYLNDEHTLRFGVDYEDLKALENTSRAGGVSYRYQDCDTAELAKGNAVDCEFVRVEYYVNAGEFKTESSAFYITDTWQATDDLTLSLGLRNELFANYNKANQKFIDVTNQCAPRVGLSWDVNSDGSSKFFANYGRYFLPVATNTNIRLAGDELYTRQLHEIVSVDPVTQVPTLGAKSGPQSTFGDGTLKPTAETVNADIDPMYQDEFIVGYEGQLNDEWNFGIKGTYRDLKSSLEDIAIDKGFNDMLVRDFGSACTLCEGFHYYVLTNPGQDVTITTDPDGDGPLKNQEYTISAADLGYPEATRQYAAVDVTFDRVWDDVWMLDLTYTWAHSWGNNEGFVRSDNDQDDAGLTTNYDQPGLTDGASGNLPNDRRHQVKIFGAYALTDDLTVGANFAWQSGRPKNVFGYHPTDVFASYYDAASFAQNGEIVPRGTLGRTPSTWSLDLSAQYTVEVFDTDLELRADIYNVFNNDSATQQNEIGERLAGYGAGDIALGEPDPDYGLATSYQTPRYVRLSASIKF